MSDLIDRKAILKNIEKIRQGVQMMDDTHRASIIMNGMYLCEKAVRNQPSVEHEQKTSKWGCTLIEGRIMCLNCGTKYDWDSQAQYYKYCPNCGVRIVRGERDE